MADNLHSEGSTNIREPPRLLKVVRIPKNNIIPGCNSGKKLVEWLRAQSAGLRKSVRVSECHKKKQEVDFDLLCRLVPRTDKSCNQFGNLLLTPILKSQSLQSIKSIR